MDIEPQRSIATQSSIQEQREQVADVFSSMGCAQFTGEVIGKVRNYPEVSYLTLMDGDTHLSLKALPTQLPADITEGFVLRVHARPRYAQWDRNPVWIPEAPDSHIAPNGTVQKISCKGPIRRKREAVARAFNLPSRPNYRLDARFSKEILRIRVLGGYGSQVLKDFRTGLTAKPGKRIHIETDYTGVQSQSAIGKIVEAIAKENSRAKSEAADLILIMRGGGTDADFLIFDDERIVAAIVNSSIPVATAVGHSEHVPLAARAAAVNFATPDRAGTSINDFNLRKVGLAQPSYSQLAAGNKELAADVERLQARVEASEQELVDAIKSTEKLRVEAVDLHGKQKHAEEEINRLRQEVLDQAKDSALNRVWRTSLRNGLWWTLWTSVVVVLAAIGGMSILAIMLLSLAPGAWAVLTFSGGVRAGKMLGTLPPPPASPPVFERLIAGLSIATAPRHVRRALRNA